MLESLFSSLLLAQGPYYLLVLFINAQQVYYKKVSFVKQYKIIIPVPRLLSKKSEPGSPACQHSRAAAFLYYCRRSDLTQ